MSSALVLPIFFGSGAIVVAAVVIANIVWGDSDNKKTPTNPMTLADHNIKYKLRLIEREVLSHDTRRFRLGLPTPNHILGTAVGEHIHLSAMINDELVIRAYTPVSSPEVKGYVDLAVKVYLKNVHPNFPNGGKMSQYLENMKIGNTIDVRGPSGRLQYVGKGNFLIKKLRKDPPTKITTKKLNMIAGGTGITPMLQLIRHICSDPTDKTQISLLFANKTEQDIIFRDELEKYAREHPDQLKLWYSVNRPENGWSYSKGYTNAAMISEHMFPATPDLLFLLCGPPSMINSCHSLLGTLGFHESRRFTY